MSERPEKQEDGGKPGPTGALLPCDDTGAEFVCYGDCCSGIPGADFERYFAAVNAVLMRLRPSPDWIIFAGDEVMGETTDYQALRTQWLYWKQHEMAWLDRGACPIYHVPSNHTGYDPQSEAIWREAHPEVPKNGPPGQEGLSYVIRRGDFLIVCMDTSFSGLGGNGHVEHTWLDEVLSANDDAAYKLVVGHYPAFAVNGYDEHPRWHIVHDQAEAFWTALVRHGVQAYICSHVIAFDVQTHEGVLQITTGGAGTLAGPGGFMPGQTEYHHLVQMAVDRKGIRYQVLDTEGVRREWLSWPLTLPPTPSWLPVQSGQSGEETTEASNSSQGSRQTRLVVWRFVGETSGQEQEEDQTILCSSNDVKGHPPVWIDGPPSVWIGLAERSLRVTVRLHVAPGAGTEMWVGPALERGQPFEFQVAIHSGMGPGGVMYRDAADSGWSTMRSSSARGAERLMWPEKWLVGHGRSGPQDLPFAGRDLRAFSYCENLRLESLRERPPGDPTGRVD